MFMEDDDDDCIGIALALYILSGERKTKRRCTTRPINKDSRNRHFINEDRSLNRHPIDKERENRHLINEERRNRHPINKEREDRHPIDEEREDRHSIDEEREDRHPANEEREDRHPTNKARGKKRIFPKLYPQLCDDEDKFYSYTRMSRGIFEELLSVVHEDLRKTHTNFQRPICPRERLLLTLRYLATGESAQSLHYQFKMGESTIRSIIYSTCDCLWEKLLETDMPPPTEESLRKDAQAFSDKWNFPHCLGAIDERHITILCPSNISGSAYSNYKKHYFIILQGVADADANFISVDVTDCERHSDGGILKHSSFGKALFHRQLPIPQPEDIMGETLPYVFVGDEVYALHQHVMRPYPPRGLDHTRRIFNNRLSRARRTVECAFRIMAQRWGVLKTSMRVFPDNARKIVLACCVLHNFIRRRGNETLAVTAEQESTDEHDFQLQRQRPFPSNGRPAQEAIEVRDKFANLFATSLTVPWQYDPAHVPPPADQVL